MIETRPGLARQLPPLAIRAWLRYDVVSSIIDRLRPETALEIGCGQGAFGSRLAEQCSYVGVEPDQESFAVASERIAARGGEVLNGFHSIVPEGSVFDLVCAFEVLEHIDDDAGALAEWIRFVRPGGHLLLSVPAFQSRFGPMDVHAGHFRRYSPEDLTSLLVGAGLTEVDVTVYAWPLGYALEAVRNRLDAKKLQKVGDASMQELTQASGRTFQPQNSWQGTLVALATTPFRWLQRLRRNAGTGLVAVARRPL